MSCPQVVKIVTPGPPGPPGPAGVSSAWLQGSGAPSAGDGAEGDFWLDTDTGDIYGPKASGAWGSSIFNIAEGQQGPAGATGPAGPEGGAGPQGAAGVDGRTILSGSGAPSNGVGADGDFFINTAASIIYGPKSTGVWPAGVSLIGATGATGFTGPQGEQGPAGPAGADGAAGAAGADGADGRTILNGSGAPSSGTGADGDFYLDTAADAIYGPKAAGAWGSPTSLIGPQGPAGADGADGAAGATGPQGPQGPAGATGATGPQGPAGVVSATAPITYDAGTQTVAISAATTSAAGSMSSADKSKLDGIAAGAEVNVNADWNASSGDAQILNKPTLGTAAAAATTDFAPAAQGVTNGNSHDHSGGDGAQIAYSSLSGLPVLPTGTNTGDQTLSNTSDATSHTVALSASGGSVQFVEGSNITLTTSGTSSAAVVTIASTDGTSPGGSDTQIQFNDAGAFGGDVDLTWNKTTNVMTLKGDINLDDGGSFTTTLQTITPTANRTVSIPDATGTVALVAGSSGQLLWNNAEANAGASTLTYDGSILTTSGRFINSYNATASAPAKVFTGTWFTGGTATTTKPQVLIEPTGATSTAWSTSGTGLGVNAASGFTGRLLDLQLNGTSEWSWSNTTFTLGDANDIAVGTTTGTKIGTATTQKLGFFNKTPVVQPTAVADATDAATVITQLNALLARMRDLGLIAT